jgi:hypothetical protein
MVSVFLCALCVSAVKTSISIFSNLQPDLCVYGCGYPVLFEEFATNEAMDEHPGS